MATDWLQTVVSILDHGKKSSSYKFALLRALADFGAEGTPGELVPYEWIVEKFIDYYWNLAVVFRVRQANRPDRDPLVMRLIRDEMRRLNLVAGKNLSCHKFRSLHPARYQHLIAEVCRPRKEGIFQVVPKLQNVSGGVLESGLYDYSDTELHLRLGVAEFLRKNHRIIRHLAIGSWVRFTEQFTSSPRLYQKIAGTQPVRRHARYIHALRALAPATCFYCGKIAAVYHIDHVVPWSFVLEDRFWNLVLACGPCNYSKRDRLPPDDYVPMLIQRNCDMIAGLPCGRPIGLSSHAARDMREYENRADELALHIKALVTNCRAEGFGVWERAGSSSAAQ